MPDPDQSETDKVITDRARGPAERVVLGKNPYGSIARIILIIVVFIGVFGSIFYFSGR